MLSSRLLTYILSLLCVGLLFSLGVVLLGMAGTSQSLLPWLSLPLALMLAPLFTPLHSLWSRLIDKDSLTARQLMNDFNKVLVSTFDLPLLLKRTSAVIASVGGSSHVSIVINPTEHMPQRTIGTAVRPTLTAYDLARINQVFAHSKRKLFMTHRLPKQQDELQAVLRTNDIVLAVRLGGNFKDDALGYMLLGSKPKGMYRAPLLLALEYIAGELVVAIQNFLRTEEVEHFNLTLQDKIAEATRKLRKSNDKLKALDEAKDDFVSMASHQLRTPLTSVKGNLSMVLEGDAGKINGTQRQLLEQAFTSSQRMVYLIADLLNVSRLKTGKFVIEPSPVNLAEVVEQEVDQLKDTASGRSLTLAYEKPSSFPPLMLDETKLRQVIMNFLDNAIYYTPAGGSIVARLVETPASVELRIEDTGIGVSKSERPHLFTKFYRAANARTARPDGTGLGLFMAKKVVTAQGGAIIFETEEGKGSTFGFVFPKSSLAVTKGTKA